MFRGPGTVGRRATGRASTLDLYAHPCNLSSETVFISAPRLYSVRQHPTIGVRIGGHVRGGVFFSRFTVFDGGPACVKRPSHDRYLSGRKSTAFTRRLTNSSVHNPALERETRARGQHLEGPNYLINLTTC